MPIKFVIAFVERSGSSYLQGMLSNHPDAQMSGENILVSDTDPARQSTMDFLNKNVHSTNKIASGFKLGNEHIFKHPEVKDIMRDFDYRVIGLTRKNKVDQYISMGLARLAQLNGSWRSEQGDFYIRSFFVDFAHMDYYLGLIEEHDRLIDEYVAGFPTAKLAYEELITPGGYFPALDLLELKANAASITVF
jgi:hypothetical protein